MAGDVGDAAAASDPSGRSSRVYMQAVAVILQRLANGGLVENEYDAVVRRDRSIDHTVAQSQLPEHGSRNRYVNVLPYDHNRVKISTTPGYVNASHVHVSDAPTALTFNYIAAQGPLPATAQEFWRMCLEEECAAVVMLTNVVERGMTKCATYFPLDTGDSASSNGIEVCNIETKTLGDLTVRKIKISCTVDGTCKSAVVTHFHYTTWPDHGTPQDSLEIRRMCDALLPARTQGETVVVHCSAGIGRTGTFIAIDFLRLKLQRLHEADVRGETLPPDAVQRALAIPDLVHHLRQQRMGMVQTLEQYIFIYRALKEELEVLIS